MKQRDNETLSNSHGHTVRVGTPADEDGIMHLCRLLHDENALFPMSEQKVIDTLRPLLARDRGIIGVIGPVGKLEGMIALMIDRIWYSDQGDHLLELLNFVHPDHRTPPGHAKALINFAKKCSDDLGLKLMIGIISNHRTEAKVRLYQRQLNQVGAFFLYGASTGGMDGKQKPDHNG